MLICEFKKKIIIMGTSLEKLIELNDKFFFYLGLSGDCYVVCRFPPQKKQIFKLPSVTTPFCIVNLSARNFLYTLIRV